MIGCSLGQIAEIVDGSLVGGDPSTLVTAPSAVDSRSVAPGGLFFALTGEHVDGHDFAAAAAERGAVAVVGSRATASATVVVADPVAALGALSRYVVSQLRGLTVFAMTGSQGKTGTKDYLSAILSTVGRTVATSGNYNNEIGVPLTVLRADPTTQFLIVEMGARARGDIEYLCRLARPHIGAVLNVGTAHLGEFGSQDAIAVAKGELVEGLPSDGVAVLNADDPRVLAMRSRTSARVVTFGAAGDVSARSVSFDEFDRPSFELGSAGAWSHVALAGIGRHQITNACAAAAMAVAAGQDVATIAAALSDARSTSRWRMELSERADGLVVINDAYNANPDSMRAAIDTLAEIGERSGRRTVAVLGEMLELGESSDALHADLGRYVAESGVDLVVTVGDAARTILSGAASTPHWPGLGFAAAGRDQAIKWVRQNVSATDVVIVKASRGAALEHVVAALLADSEREHQ